MLLDKYLAFVWGGVKCNLRVAKNWGGNPHQATNQLHQLAIAPRDPTQKFVHESYMPAAFLSSQPGKALGARGDTEMIIYVLGGTIRLYLYRYTVLYPCSTEP